MPRKVKVSIEDAGDGTATVWIGPFGHQTQVADLFDRSYLDELQIRSNVGLAFRIGGYAQPDSIEFLGAVNQGVKGLEGRSGNVRIEDIGLDDSDAERYNVTFAVKTGPHAGETFILSIRTDELREDAQDDQTVLRNIPSWLRKGGHVSLTPAAVAGLNAAEFWE